MYKLQVLITDTPGQYLISVAIIRLLESCWLDYVAGLGPLLIASPCMVKMLLY